MNDLSVHENSLQETADTDYKDAKRTSLFGARQVLKIRWSQGFVPRGLGRNEALRRTQGLPVLSPPDLPTWAQLQFFRDQNSNLCVPTPTRYLVFALYSILMRLKARFQPPSVSGFQQRRKMELHMLAKANCYWFEFIWYISKKLGLVYRVSGNASS